MLRDRVTSELALEVFERDGGCVAVALGASSADCGGRLTLDHVKDQPAVGASRVKRADKHRYRAPSDKHHLVSVCQNHHIWNGWATAHRPELRAYLASQEDLR
jgi:hypothetical protein